MESDGFHFYQRTWFKPLAQSAAIHLILVLLALFVHFRTPADENENLMEFRLKKVNASAVPSGPAGGGGSGSVGRGQKGALRFPQVSSSAPERSLVRLKSRSAEEKSDVESGISQIPMENKVNPIPSSARNLDSLIFESQREDSTRRVQVRQESMQDYYQKSAEKSVRAVAPSGEGLMRSLSKSLGKIQLYSPANMAVDPEEGMPGFTPSAGSGTGGMGNGRGTGLGDGFGPGPGGPGVSEGNDEGGSGISPYEAIDQFMDIQVYTYKDPVDSQKYFMIKIYAKPGTQALKVMPKEVLFTIDCSLSISADRLDQFKRGIRYCLTHLNPQDVFNVVAFKDRVTFFSPQSVPATRETIRGAEKFVGDLAASQATDVYGAFAKIIEKPLARKPSNVILISDGKPTHGVVDSRDLINSITRINGRARPMFAFTGGAKVNRYLLDFIAYQNRGWSQYVQRTGDIWEGLAEFYDKIRNPVFLNLRYRMNNLDAKEVFPKSLPDFYRNAEFTLYGKYTSENEFSMQLLGDIEGKTKELIFSRALRDAKQGDEEIMRGYAFNKIYHLISRMTTEGQTPALRAQVDQLSRKYVIKTPYSAELERVD